MVIGKNIYRFSNRRKFYINYREKIVSISRDNIVIWFVFVKSLFEHFYHEETPIAMGYVYKRFQPSTVCLYMYNIHIYIAFSQVLSGIPK